MKLITRNKVEKIITIFYKIFSLGSSFLKREIPKYGILTVPNLLGYPRSSCGFWGHYAQGLFFYVDTGHYSPPICDSHWD